MEENLIRDGEDGIEKEVVCVCIDKYRVEEGRVKKFVVYLISGQDSAGVFQTGRRYKEFKVLRRILCDEWPCCIIPELPKKKAVGNLRMRLIHKRKKLLNYFIGRAVSYNFLYKSEVFQLFLRIPESFLQSSKSLRALKFSEIAENLKEKSEFSDSFQITKAHINLLSNLYSILEDALTRVKSFKKCCKKIMLSFYRYVNSLCTLSTSLRKVSQFFYPNKEASDTKKKSKNPFKVLFNWSQREIVEIESVLEKIEKRSQLERVLAKNQARLDKQQQDLDDIQSGKKSLMQLFKNKNKEKTANQLQYCIFDSEKEIKALQEVIRISTEQLVNYKLPIFKEKEVEKLETMIRCYSGALAKEFNTLISYFTVFQIAKNQKLS